jgi:hypothetical protein
MDESMSEHGRRAMAEIVERGLDGPRIVYERWASGVVTPADLNELIPRAWQNVKSPEHTIGREKWLALFHAAGFFAPPGIDKPLRARTLYRGSTHDRMGGMAWALYPETARDLGKWHDPYGPVDVFQCVAPPDAVLAIFLSATEGYEFILDPSKITSLRKFAA